LPLPVIRVLLAGSNRTSHIVLAIPMGSLKKRRKAKIAKHKRKKRMKENRHKKRLRYKS
jgi:hypothetical protein